MYNFVFFQFYQLSAFFKNNVPGSIFYYSDIDSVIMLSGLEFLNLASIWLYFNFGNITNMTSLDVILGFFILFGLNYLYFLHKGRYKVMIEECKRKSLKFKIIGQMITVFYVVISIFIFHKIHSS